MIYKRHIKLEKLENILETRSPKVRNVLYEDLGTSFQVLRMKQQDLLKTYRHDDFYGP